MGKPTKPPRKGSLPNYRCAICGGPVVELDLVYRCQPEGVTWAKDEASLLVRFDT